MANIPIYDGNPIWNAGSVPFGFYNNDTDFQIDAVKVAKFCAIRLGYPIENVELDSGSFFTAFEMATTVYGNELYAFLVRENLINFEGMDLNAAPSTFQNAVITPNFSNIIRVSEQYGSEAGSGGNVNWYSGSIIMTASKQEYDLDEWAQDQGISGSELEVKRIFYQGVPASADYYYNGGIGIGAGWNSFFGGLGGVAGYGIGNNFFVTPLSYTVQAIQEVELAEDILVGAYSFELINNKLKIFPVPGEADDGLNFWFEYVVKSERFTDSITTGSGAAGSGYISNVSNMPYNNPVYAQINSIGRSWIFEYTLAQTKEMLGYVRNKYSQIPIPGAAVTLNGGDLIAAATSEKTALIDRLRAYFDETSRKARLERRKDEAEFAKSDLNNVPMTIYIG